MVSFVGQFIPRKGTLRLCEALKKIDDGNVKAIFIGSGVEDPDFSGIIFKGRVPHVAFATFAGSAFTYIASFALSSVKEINMPDLLVISRVFFASTLLMWLERVAVKRMFDGFRAKDATPVAIYGTKNGGISIAYSIINAKVKEFRLVAFISDGEEMKNTYLLGKKVLLNGKGIAEDLKQRGVKVLLVSPLKSEMFRKNTAMGDEDAVSLVKKVGYVTGGEIGDLVCCTRYPEVGSHKLFFRGELYKAFVVLIDFLSLVFIKPVFKFLHNEFVHYLGIELLIVYGALIVETERFKAEKTSCTGIIVQDVPVVCGAHKRCQTLAHFGAAVIGQADKHV